MIKTFLFVLTVIFSDGSQERIPLKSGTTAEECSALLTGATRNVLDTGRPMYLAKEAILACEEEDNA